MKRQCRRALIQYRDPKNYDLVMEALKKTGRMDLVGYDKRCLIRPEKGKSSGWSEKGKSGKNVRDNTRKKKHIRNVHKRKKK